MTMLTHVGKHFRYVSVSNYFASLSHTAKFSTATVGHQTSTRYCSDLIRKHDFENYLCTMFLPSNARSAAIALRAFNTEIALIDQSVSDINIAKMRLQFWNDTIDRIYRNSPPEHPVAEELYKAVSSFKLSRPWLQRMLDSRANYMGNNSFNTIKDVEDYAEHTISSLYYLILQSIGVQSVDCDHAASHLGKCYGMCCYLRSLRYHCQRPAAAPGRRVLLPTDLLLKYQLSEQAVIRVSDGEEAQRHDMNTMEKLRSVIYDTAAVAYQHMNAARHLKEKIPAEAKNIFLPCVMCEWYLDEIRRHDFHVFHDNMHRRNLLLPWKLWRRSKKRSVL